MARRVDLVFVGDPPMLDDFAKLQIAMGEMPPEAATILRAADAQRTTAVKGVDKRLIEPEYFPGLSQPYTFGPDVFERSVDAKDADIILGSSSGHQFRRKGAPEDEIVKPPSHFVLVSEEEITPRQLRGSLHGA